jgi:hypothetical protein
MVIGLDLAEFPDNKCGRIKVEIRPVGRTLVPAKANVNILEPRSRLVQGYPTTFLQ